LIRLGGGAKSLPGVPLRTGVVGVFTDNWLAPEVIMAPSASRRGPLILIGEAAKDCLLRITAGKVLLLERRLAGGTRTRIDFPGTGEAITLHFDQFVDEGGRRFSFLLDYTNCFSEGEIAW
jgi:hypothetical protein